MRLHDETVIPALGRAKSRNAYPSEATARRFGQKEL